MKTIKVSKKTWALLTFFILLALFLYIISMGKIDISSKGEGNDSLDERIKRSERQQQKLRELIAKKEELKKKLLKRFSYVYFFARLMMLMGYFGINILLYNFFDIQTLSDLLNWNKVLLIGLIGINFLCFGNITNLKRVISYFKRKLENIVYTKYANIGEQIENHKIEASTLEVLINGFKTQAI